MNPLSKVKYFVVARLTWACVMLCMVLLAVVNPDWLMNLLDEFSKRQWEQRVQERMKEES